MFFCVEADALRLDSRGREEHDSIVTRVEPERSDKTKEVAECFHRVSRAAMIAPA
jgi:ribose 1,5-bisphosphokinase PhnN